MRNFINICAPASTFCASDHFVAPGSARGVEQDTIFYIVFPICKEQTSITLAEYDAIAFFYFLFYLFSERHNNNNIIYVYMYAYLSVSTFYYYSMIDKYLLMAYDYTRQPET